MIKMSEYAKRRKRLMQTIGPRGIAILPAAPLVRRNGDYDYPYRPNSDFYYLTGFEEPEAVAVFLPKNKTGEFLLFNRERDRNEEIWEGARAGQKGACDIFQADASFPIKDFKKKLPELIEGQDTLHYALGLNKTYDDIVIEAINQIRGKIRSGVQSPISIQDISPTVHEMRLIKSPAEIAIMRKAANISVDAHLRAMQACQPGLYEYQLEAELHSVFNREGARYPAYTSIVGAGKNSCTLHYTTNNQKIKEKDIVLIDAGCEFQNYASDITRTFPASGRFSAEQQAIYDIVLEAQEAGIRAIRPGALWSVVQEVVVKILTQGLREIGLLKGSLNELIEKKAYLKFYMHNSGHWLGLDVHDVGRYKLDGKWRRFLPHMVLTVEPGLYISSDIPGVPKRFQHIGVRIEDDVLVTEKGCEVLTKRLPKKREEIEALMRHGL